LQTLKELQSLEPSLKYHHNPTQEKKQQKGIRYKKEKNRKKVYP